MRFSETDYFYLKICLEKKKTHKTADELAKKFDCSAGTINNAVQWGRDHSVFRAEAKELLDTEIARVVLMIDRVDDKCKTLEQSDDANATYKANTINNYYKTLIQLMTYLHELEAIYKNTVQVTIQEESENPMYKKLCELTERLKGFESAE